MKWTFKEVIIKAQKWVKFYPDNFPAESWNEMSLNYRNDPELEKASEAVNSQLKLWNEGKKL